MTDSIITPTDLARQLGVAPRRIRKYLREQHAVDHMHFARWELTVEQATDVRAHFGDA